jgi:hypothetical protein
MLADYEARSRYLTLALEARRVIDLLLVFVQSGERAPDFDSSVRRIIDSLQSIGSAENLLASLQTRLTFRNYEQITTLDEVIGLDARKLLADKLAILLTGGSNLESQKQSAVETIQFLYDVESRALHHFNEPGSSQFTAAYSI